MKFARALASLLVFLALLFFALDNAEPVTLRFFRLASWQAPLVFVVFAAFAIGVALGLVAGVARSSRLKRQLVRARRGRKLPAVPAPHGAAPPSGTAMPPRDAV